MELTLKQAVDMIGELKNEVTKLSGHVDRLLYENCKLRKENGVLRDKLISLGDTTINIRKCKIIKQVHDSSRITGYKLLYSDNTTSLICVEDLKDKMKYKEIDVSNAILTSNNRLVVRW